MRLPLSLGESAIGTLDGRVAVITGAGRGLGHAFAVGFAREGSRVVLIGRRLGPAGNPETLEHTAELVREAGGEALCIEGSVADVEAMRHMALQSVDRFGGVDILVNNAGMYHPETFSDTTLAKWREVIESFLRGAFVCARVITPLLIQRGGGHIINLGSLAAMSDDANAFAYGVIRSATLRMTPRWPPTFAATRSPLTLTVPASC